jgi:hypothetical protein
MRAKVGRYLGTALGGLAGLEHDSEGFDGHVHDVAHLFTLAPGDVLQAERRPHHRLVTNLSEFYLRAATYPVHTPRSPIKKRRKTLKDGLRC